jgi:hypothetical protein
VIVEARVFARVAYSVAAAAGLVLGAIAVMAGPAAAVGWVVVGVFVGALATSLWRQAIRDGAVWATSGPGRRAGLRVGVATCAGGLVLTGLARLLGPSSGIVILTLLLLAAPLAWPWLRRRYGQPPGRETWAAGCAEVVPAAEPPLPLTFEALSTPELCLAWRRSYLALLDVTSYPARWQIVRQRECLLDELERRDPDGFTCWLDSGASAGSDPGRYLSSDR